MIKFNNYPPKEVGDVELTEGAREHLIEVNCRMNDAFAESGYCEEFDQGRKQLRHYGQAIGHTLLSAVASPEPEVVKPLADSIVFDYSLTVAERDSRASELSVGLHSALEAEAALIIAD